MPDLHLVDPVAFELALITAETRVGPVGVGAADRRAAVGAAQPRPGFRRHLWVPNWSSTSRDLDVFVYQPVEQIAASQMKLGWRCRWW
jgi:hypothetical protein